MSYPEIKSQVTYIRVLDGGLTEDGSGELRSIYADPTGRVMAQVAAQSGVYNVDAVTLDAIPAAAAAYKALIAQVHEVSQRGNTAVKALVDSYNAQVDALYAGIGGQK